MTTSREATDVRKQGAGSARAVAGLRELETRTIRDTRHVERVDETLAHYYTAVGRAERIRVGGRRRAARVLTTARRKADEITLSAEREAAGPQAEAQGFIRDLLHLVGGKAEVAELCGLTVKAVTDILTAPLPVSAGAEAGAGAGAAGVAGASGVAGACVSGPDPAAADNSNIAATSVREENDDD